MPTKINGSLTVHENLSSLRIWLAKLFGLFLKLHDVNDNDREIRLKASIIAHTVHTTDAEVQAQKDAKERDRLARETAQRKIQEDQAKRGRMVTPAIPSNRYHK
jgi:hypothetical protein